MNNVRDYLSMTIRDSVSAALRVRGYALVKGQSRRLQTFWHPEDPNNWYLGPSGAIRQGRTATDSEPVPEETKQRLIREGKQLLSIVSYGPVDD